ncbi:hypothetical protein TNCV_2564691 [Trichonephila clavipes]|nr:hypothetical protein TNCV_2564691 [Trichonephila clavipes]
MGANFPPKYLWKPVRDVSRQVENGSPEERFMCRKAVSISTNRSQRLHPPQVGRHARSLTALSSSHVSSVPKQKSGPVSSMVPLKTRHVEGRVNSFGAFVEMEIRYRPHILTTVQNLKVRCQYTLCCFKFNIRNHSVSSSHVSSVPKQKSGPCVEHGAPQDPPLSSSHVSSVPKQKSGPVSSLVPLKTRHVEGRVNSFGALAEVEIRYRLHILTTVQNLKVRCQYTLCCFKFNFRNHSVSSSHVSSVPKQKSGPVSSLVPLKTRHVEGRVNSFGAFVEVEIRYRPHILTTVQNLKVRCQYTLCCFKFNFRNHSVSSSHVSSVPKQKSGPVSSMVPLKTRHAEGRVNSFGAFVEVEIRCRPHILTRVQNLKVRCQYTLCCFKFNFRNHSVSSSHVSSVPKQKSGPVSSLVPLKTRHVEGRVNSFGAFVEVEIRYRPHILNTVQNLKVRCQYTLCCFKFNFRNHSVSSSHVSSVPKQKSGPVSSLVPLKTRHVEGRVNSFGAFVEVEIRYRPHILTTVQNLKVRCQYTLCCFKFNFRNHSVSSSDMCSVPKQKSGAVSSLVPLKTRHVDGRVNSFGALVEVEIRYRLHILTTVQNLKVRCQYTLCCFKFNFRNHSVSSSHVSSVPMQKSGPVSSLVPLNTRHVDGRVNSFGAFVEVEIR